MRKRTLALVEHCLEDVIQGAAPSASAPDPNPSPRRTPTAQPNQTSGARIYHGPPAQPWPHGG